MMQQTRLCDGKRVPALLRDAFQALARDAPGAETVARVECSLEVHAARTHERANVAKASRCGVDAVAGRELGPRRWRPIGEAPNGSF